MAYWGLAQYDAYKWDTLRWLQDRASHANQFKSPEDFARDMTCKLNIEIYAMAFHRQLDAGIGIHFTSYEYINNYWVPELFLLSNFSDPSYTSLHIDGVHLSRQTYGVVASVEPQPSHRETQYRLDVHKRLLEGGFLLYNNGDPMMFNAAADAILVMIQEIEQRRNLTEPDKIETYQQIARTPIELVSRVQERFVRKGNRVVGGRIHDLAVTPNGEYFSKSGDA